MTALEARAAALDESGWGKPLSIVQPRALIFWVLVAGMVLGVVQMVRDYRPGIGAYWPGVAAGVLLFGAYTVPWLVLLGHHNRYSPLPGKLRAIAVVWGAVPATYLLGGLSDRAGVSLWTKAFGSAWARDWAGGLTAPFTEEAAKATALVLLIGLAPGLVRGPYDGLIIGAYAGLGLQISEDISYVYVWTAQNFGAGQASSAFAMFVSRAPAGLVQHVLFSAVFCAGLMWLLGRGDGGHRARGVLLILGVIVLHSGWDNIAAYGEVLAGPWGVRLMVLALVVAGLALLWLTFRLARPQELRWLRAVLQPEVEAGVLTAPEADAIAGGRRTRRRLRVPHKRRLLAAGRTLAGELARTGGEESEPVADARAAIARLKNDAT